ncbi:hypothetical protein PIB30_053161 [Stylosanthes scabra]|uniref:Ubiquitin-like protease family profile domain-containing protein n=1 Tax=Stylosanthes scabra TaxID=79078 RepID=A0ABU6TI53_9FABA|nr:hypothetical protein [Stylosanthes scabra]
MNDVQMKIAEKKIKRILKLREELRELENAETPQKPETSRTRIYNWATQCKDTNQFDCGVYVLKYMEIVNPNDLAKRNFKIPAWSKEQLARFREQIIERILCDVDNEFREMVMQVTNPHARYPRPSRALQNPYIQLDSGDLTSK